MNIHSIVHFGDDLRIRWYGGVVPLIEGYG